MVIMYIERKLIEKSKAHRDELKKLAQVCDKNPAVSQFSCAACQYTVSDATTIDSPLTGNANLLHDQRYTRIAEHG